LQPITWRRRLNAGIGALVKELEVDGCSYDLSARSVLKPDAVYVDVEIRTNAETAAALRFRCASHEPQFESFRQLPDSAMNEAVLRIVTPDKVRSAVWFQSELRKQNPESPVRGVLHAIFPENYRSEPSA
jgi:hypothetical protein